ncbi:MAG: copper resistance protein CopC [Chloroflexi bacterium]|nr:copper resistance protein CopC [Chloroflexota bacterium]MDA8237973.1 copper resistance protein CopC [Chloroflexota bacterium]
MARPFLCAVVAAAFLSLVAAPVFAHAELVSALPGPGEEVEGSPTELVATFNQDLDPSRTSLEVRDASGTTVARGGELGDGPREFRLALPELPPGGYEVRWTSFSAEDGELARDSYTFTVVAAPSPSPSPSPAPSTPASPSPTPAPTTPSPLASATPVPGDTVAAGDGVVLLPILAASLVIGAIGVWLLRRRAT